MLEYLEKDKDISFFSSFRTKSSSKYFFQINNLDDIKKLKNIIIFANKESLKYQIIGGGTNLLFGFEKYEGIIIRNKLKYEDLNFLEKDFLSNHNNKSDTKSQKDTYLKVLSGDNVIKVTRQLIDKGQTKLSPLLGLPGTFGGALRGNAGCFGLEIKDILVSAKLLNLETLEEIEVDKNFFNFDYRYSILKDKKKYFIISMILNINHKIEVSNNVEESLEKRKKTQAYGATCGSFFKNPYGDYAGRLIESVGLKGKEIGGAIISEKHANFFLNQKDASYKDILNLRDLAKEKVLKTFGIKLEEEVKIIQN